MLNLITVRRVTGTAVLALAFSTFSSDFLIAQKFSILNPPTDVIEAPVPSQIPQQQADVDLLTRGQLHEAFAEVSQRDATPNPMVQTQPPESIKELPPEFKPDGENVEWIPGYWAWDDDRTSFIWISGIWRDVPPGQRWVPGYWESAAEGFRWVNGFWMTSIVEQVNYLPPAPANLDYGPSTPSPSDNHFYAPGSWIYQADDYIWQPVCWMPRVENMVWVPPAYIWTPVGCVFRPGYWDRLFDCRGVVFAPVCFRRPVYRDVNYCYTPSCVINTNFDLLPHLFVRYNCRSYYFGDWYDDRYVGNDFCAWSQISYRPRFDRCYDPFYAYYNTPRIQHNHVALINWVRDQHDYCHQHVDYRPQHSFSLQVNFQNHSEHRGNGHGHSDHAILADTLQHHVQSAPKQIKGRDSFKRIDEHERMAIQRASDPIVTIARDRKALEKGSNRHVGHGDTAQVNPVLKSRNEHSTLSLPKTERQQLDIAERSALELKRQQEQLERATKLAERRKQRDAKPSNELSNRASDVTPVLKNSDQLPRNQRSTDQAGRSNERGRQVNGQTSTSDQTVVNPLSNGDAQPLDKPVLRQMESDRRRQELQNSQQQRELKRQQEKQFDVQQRVLQQQQLSEKNHQQLANRQIEVEQRNSQQVIQRQLQQQQQQTKQLEIQQHRAVDQAASQVAQQQRQIESTNRRQQDADARSQRQQQNQLQQQQRSIQNDQAREQRNSERQQQNEGRNKKKD